MSILIKGINLPKGDPTVALLIEIPCEGKASCEVVRMDEDGEEDSTCHTIEVEQVQTDSLIEDAYKKIALKNIALKLLDKYAVAQDAVIWEYSGNIEHELKALEKEVAEYREAIEEAAK